MCGTEPALDSETNILTKHIDVPIFSVLKYSINMSQLPSYALNTVKLRKLLKSVRLTHKDYKNYWLPEISIRPIQTFAIARKNVSKKRAVQIPVKITCRRTTRTMKSHKRALIKL